MVEVPSQADIGWQDELWIGRSANDVVSWTQILGVEEVAMPEKAPDDIGTTHMQSPGRSKETMPGMLAAADWSQDLQFWPEHPSHLLLDELAGLTEAGTREDVQIAFVVGGLQRTYRGYVNTYVPSGSVGEKRMVALGCKIFERITPNPTLPQEG
ncbi:hypothetical protein [Rhodobacter lacus]|uniref:Uncharacterized protein n=1 Tax=Rhodobacter lacus TaxID=1641972 RepID=A0ABW5AEH0_9RHOB